MKNNLETATTEAIEKSREYPTEFVYIYQIGAGMFGFRFRPMPPQEPGLLVAIYKNGASIRRAPSQ